MGLVGEYRALHRRTACIRGAARGRRLLELAWEEVEFCRETLGPQTEAFGRCVPVTEDAGGWGMVTSGRDNWKWGTTSKWEDLYLRQRFVF